MRTTPTERAIAAAHAARAALATAMDEMEKLAAPGLPGPTDPENAAYTDLANADELLASALVRLGGL